ncbi:MAG: Pyruvate:ferredoxin oxidoreductase or related 2-oxoacid:ferredoxin oxidoreductase [Candidatus Alkanophagales archaeon MCA70_species_1]|nr:Pyruvate:ferredoxin oxidoreductase or related 2-oxoacid:ferredoxin oxidoreductase [Candidatus Alkanophaga volatiphilum]
MPRRVALEGSHAVSEAVRMADVDVIAAYPITPQTHIVERLAEMVANGELDAEFICVESEHSAMSAVVGAAACGARVFTCTAGQGLELMHEVLFVPSAMRLPVVAVIANRALSAPLNVWGDHSDVMAIRDCGWIQMFAENAQQAFDLTLCAYKVAERPDVLLPAMVHIDGFHVSHVVEPVLLPEEETVREFLPPSEYPFPLDPDRPVSMGCYGPPYIYTEVKKAQEVAIENSYEKVLETFKEFKDVFGREYRPVETYRVEDADMLLLMMGSYAETAMLAIDALRERGDNVGLVRLRLWRPFPAEELRNVLRGVKAVCVFERAISFGMGGPLCAEVRAALYHLPEGERPKVVSFVGGLGGRDVSVEEFEAMLRRAKERVSSDELEGFEFVGLRE